MMGDRRIYDRKERAEMDKHAQIEASAGRGRGRPRSDVTDRAILQAAWDLLSKGSYDGLTFEAIADHAHCGRPTIYRRFRNKAEIVTAILNTMLVAMELRVTDGDDPRAALLNSLEAFVRYLAAGHGGVILALSQARRRDVEISAILDRVYDRFREVYLEGLRRATRLAKTDEQYIVCVDAMLGAILFNCVFREKPVARSYLEFLVDEAITSGPGRDNQ
jgi:AcrR family transcriptional regulator